MKCPVTPMFFQFQLIFAQTGTLCLMLFAPTNLQTHGVAHQVCYNLFSIWDPFNKAYRTTCSRARDKEKLSKVKKKPWKTNLWQFDFYSTCWNKTSGSKKQIQLQLFPGSLHLVRFITSNWFETFIILTAGENKLGLVSIILQFNKTFFYISSKALAKRFLLWNQLWNMLPKLWTRHQRKWGN